MTSMALSLPLASTPFPGGADAACAGQASPLPSAGAIYRRLIGCAPAHALVGDTAAFDRHVLAAILAVSASEGGPVASRCGLAAHEISDLLHRFFPAVGDLGARWQAHASPLDEESAMVRDLLLAQRSADPQVGGWLAAMLARRAMEPNHLWEDLGLRARDELTRLMNRHFAPLAGRNTRNMRWKRFFYRSLCEDDGFVMCATPVCTECGDFALCFGDESGESRMAERRRSIALAAPAS